MSDKAAGQKARCPEVVMKWAGGCVAPRSRIDSDMLSFLYLPVFVHEKNALAAFRLFSTQLAINGNATQAEISRAFGVPLVTVKRYVKLYREHGAAAFFAPAKKRSGSKLT